jgi:iron complex outermembrane receptor protein
VSQLGEIVVTADPLGRSDGDVITNVVLVRGDDLVQRRQSTLGETLTGIPGVNSDTFGGGSSRPVIRGQTSPRVRVLSDGAAVIDASEVSPDHAVSGEPLLLDGIEILRGPSALIYGGGAIGGAVNLIDRKIPTSVPVNTADGVAEIRAGSADDEEAGVVGVTVGAGSFALRLEAASRRTGDYRVPFYTPPGHDDHDDHDHDHDHDDDDHEEGFNRLPGSFNKTSTVTIGGSWIGARGYLGAAYTEQRSRYGLPGHNHEYEDCHPHGSSLHCGGHDHDDEHRDDQQDPDRDGHAERGPRVVDQLPADGIAEQGHVLAEVEVVLGDLLGGLVEHHHRGGDQHPQHDRQPRRRPRRVVRGGQRLGHRPVSSRRLQSMHNVAWGSASSRSVSIGLPQRSQVP